jgi:hypothetical protein
MLGPFSRLKTDHEYLAQAAKALQSRKTRQGMRARPKLSFRGASKMRTRNLWAHNIEIPGLVLRTIPE